MAIISGGKGIRTKDTSSPIFYNGNMAVCQKDTSVTGKTAGGYYASDRMNMLITNCGTYTIAQEALTSGNAFANGFANAWRVDCTSADASPASGDIVAVQQIFEGQDVQMFKKGTANAEKFTLAFWVKSNKTGNGQVNLFDNDTSGNRLVGATYAISSADTWEHKVVNFPADTTGPLDDDNAKSFIVEWWLDSGTDYSSGAVPSAWEAKSNTDRNAGGALQIARNTANDWAITGVQLEVGEYSSTTLPPFQHESFGDNLARCQRYFYRNASVSASMPFTSGVVNGTTNSRSVMRHPQPMRAAPAMGRSDNADFKVYCGSTNVDTTNVAFYYPNIYQALLYVDVSSGLTNGQGCVIIDDGNNSAYIQGDAEL